MRSPVDVSMLFFTNALTITLMIVLLLSGCAPRSAEPELTLTGPELEWVGQQIFQNECAAKPACLVHWNEGEAFPSLGIGHFIWYPRGIDGRFVESFPRLIEFMRARSLPLPAWLDALEPLDAPWADREAFMAVKNGERVQSLQRFLAESKGVQAEFIVARARASLERVVAAAPREERDVLEKHLAALSATPGGTYALIDYVNFKGEGLSPREAYNGQGWGLLQVLQAMPGAGAGTALDQFRDAATEVLSRRAENATNPIERQQWLAGWLNRLKTYREPVAL